jgi:hypothetical protein
MRRARTKSLVQVGSLVEKSGLLKTFDLPIGRDFQKDGELKMQISALFKGLLVLNDIATSEDAHLELWGHQGLAALSKTKKGTSER